MALLAKPVSIDDIDSNIFPMSKSKSREQSNCSILQKSLDDLRQSQDRCEQLLQRLVLRQDTPWSQASLPCAGDDGDDVGGVEQQRCKFDAACIMEKPRYTFDAAAWQVLEEVWSSPATPQDARKSSSISAPSQNSGSKTLTRDVSQPENGATVGIDLNHNGQPDVFVSGADLDGDRVTDILEDTPELVLASAVCVDKEAVEQNKGDDTREIIDVWEDFQVTVNEYEDKHNSYKTVTDRVKQRGHSVWHALFKHCDKAHLLHTDHPTNYLARICQHHVFVIFQTMLILTNTAIMGYEADTAIKAALQVPKGEKPSWLPACNMIYNLLFTAELLFRIVALRSWFWVAAEEWGWNVFDVTVVVTSLITDFIGGANFSWIRSFRFLRAVRAVRVIRVLRFFRELRKILFAIMACITSLFWCFLFLGMTMFMFSILILQGLVDALDDMDPSSQEHKLTAKSAGEYYGSLGDSMFSLLAAFTGGDDFITFGHPIHPAGSLYSIAYVIYMVFVIVGVMNVLTGVFLAAADSFTDRSLIVQGEQMEQEAFVLSMLQVFEDLDLDANGLITWAEFRVALQDESLQAFLSAHQFEVTHARLIFDILDEQDDGKVSLLQFVMGMLRLRGEAKAIDARIIQREIGMLPKLLNPNLLNKQYRNRKSCHS